MQLKIIRNEDDKIFDVESYRVGSDGFYHINCKEWEGHHRLGVDCEIYDPKMTYEEMYEEVSKHKNLILEFMKENNVKLIDLTEDSFYTPNGLKIYHIFSDGNVDLRGAPILIHMNKVDAISTFKMIYEDLNSKETLIKFIYEN